MIFTLLNQYTVPFPQTSIEPLAGVECIGPEGGTSCASFNEIVQRERQACIAGDTVKVLYLLRQGHGEHNDIPKYPMPHWSRLKGLYNPNTVDPPLSQIGEEQMSHLSLPLKQEDEMPRPDKVFTSITRRTCQSAIDVWRPICGQVPIIALQDLRDTLCNLGFSRRGPLGVIRRLFPGITIPEGTSENDDPWLETGGIETSEQLGERVESAFQGMWEMSKDDDCIALVAHRDIYDSIYTRILGIENPDFQTAEMRVVIVKQSE